MSIAVSLLDRRDDGVEVFLDLQRELARHEVADSSRPTIAGILAVSLEPAQALRRWLVARTVTQVRWNPASEYCYWLASQQTPIHGTTAPMF